MPPSALERLAFALWRRARPRPAPAGGGSALGELLPPGPRRWAGAAALGSALADALRGPGLPEDRVLHQQLAFYRLRRAAAEADTPGWVGLADAALERWLADPPLEAWKHPTDAAIRLLCWAAGLGFGPPPGAATQERLAQAAAEHGTFTRRHLSLRSDQADHRLALQAAALVAAGCAWPALHEAAGWRAEGLTLLGEALPRLVGMDGSPVLSPPGGLLAALEAALFARALALRARSPWPAAADGALVRGAAFARAFGEGGPVPAVGEPPPEGPLRWGDQPWGSPWDAVVALGLDPGPAGPGAAVDAQAAWLAGRVAAAGPALAPPEGWSMLHARDGGWVLVHGRMRAMDSRLVIDAAHYGPPWAHADAGQVLWATEGAELLIDPGAWPGHAALGGAVAHGVPVLNGRALFARLDGARVDGRDASVRLRLDPPGGAGLRLGVEREVRLSGARLVLSDRVHGPGEAGLTLHLPLGTGWALEPRERGWEGQLGRLRLDVQVEGPLDWALELGERVSGGALVEGPVLVGRGRVRAGDRVRVKLELR